MMPAKNTEKNEQVSLHFSVFFVPLWPLSLILHYELLPVLTASTNAFALFVIAFQSPLSIASLLTSADPAPTNTAPALIQSGVVFVSTPPVGVSRSCGSGARMSLK